MPHPPLSLIEKFTTRAYLTKSLNNERLPLCHNTNVAPLERQIIGQKMFSSPLQLIKLLKKDHDTTTSQCGLRWQLASPSKRPTPTLYLHATARKEKPQTTHHLRTAKWDHHQRFPSRPSHTAGPTKKIKRTNQKLKKKKIATWAWNDKEKCQQIYRHTQNISPFIGAKHASFRSHVSPRSTTIASPHHKDARTRVNQRKIYWNMPQLQQHSKRKTNKITVNFKLININQKARANKVAVARPRTRQKLRLGSKRYHQKEKEHTDDINLSDKMHTTPTSSPPSSTSQDLCRARITTHPEIGGQLKKQIEEDKVV